MDNVANLEKFGIVKAQYCWTESCSGGQVQEVGEVAQRCCHQQNIMHLNRKKGINNYMLLVNCVKSRFLSSQRLEK